MAVKSADLPFRQPVGDCTPMISLRSCAIDPESPLTAASPSSGLIQNLFDTCRMINKLAQRREGDPHTWLWDYLQIRS
jgi:hypothetical protein